MNKRYNLLAKLVFLIFLILIIISIVFNGGVARVRAEDNVGVSVGTSIPSSTKPIKVIDTPLTILDHQFWPADYEYKVSAVITIPLGMSLSIENGAVVDVIDNGSFYVEGGVLNVGSGTLADKVDSDFDPVSKPFKISTPIDFLSGLNSLSNVTLGASSSLSTIDGLYASSPYKVSGLLPTKISISGSGYENLFYINNAGVVNGRKIDIQGPIGVDLQRNLIGLYKKSKINLFETNINNIKIEGSNTFYSNDSRAVLYRTNINNYSGNTFADVFKNSVFALLRTKIIDAKLNSGINVFSGSILNFQKSTISAKPLSLSSFSSGTCVEGFSNTTLNVSGSDIGPCFIGFNLSGTGNFKINQNNFIGNGDVVINFSPSSDFKNNWWGNADGPKPTNLSSLDSGGNYSADEYASVIKNQNGIEDYSHGVTSVPFSAVPFKEASPCCSSVLFIPGIQGSRLYKSGLFGTENQLWEPNRNADVESLFLNSNGASLDSRIYTRDIISKTNFFGPIGSIDIYQSLVDLLSKEKTDGNIADFQTLAYDWRFLPSNILATGIKTDSYTLMLKDKIKEMANKSPSGKVIIIAHSYGGLLAKALMEDLEKEGNDSLIESSVLVSVPEYGTPQSIPAILYGDNEDLLGGLILTKKTAMGLAKNMLSAHLLLPSNSYFTESDGIYNQKNIINFDNWTISKFKLGVGKVDSFPLLDDFLKNKNLNSSINDFVFDKANSEHNLIDNYSSALSGKTYSIVPVGIPTLAGMNFVKPKCRGLFFCFANSISQPDFTRKYSLMGDGVVIAHNLARRAGSVFTVDIGKENEVKKTSLAYYKEDSIAHKDIFRSSGVKDILHAILSRSKKEGDMVNSFGLLSNPYVSYVSGSLSKPGPILGSYGDSSILSGISKISDDASDSDFIKRFNDSKILVVDAYGPITLAPNFQTISDLQNKPYNQLNLENRVVNYTSYSDGNRSGIVSVVSGGFVGGSGEEIGGGANGGSVGGGGGASGGVLSELLRSNSNIFGQGSGVGIAQIVTKIDGTEIIYPNISVTPTTNIDINYSTTTISIDNNGDGVTDKNILPIQINTSTSTGTSTDLDDGLNKESIDDLFEKAKARIRVAVSASSTSFTSASTFTSTSTLAATSATSSSAYLADKYIDKLDIAKRKYQKSGVLQSLNMLNSFYGILESNMDTVSKLILKYNKEQSFYSINKFFSTNKKVQLLNQRQVEIREEILLYIEIHDAFSELIQGVGRGL